MLSPYDVLPDELASRIKDTGDCWEWTGAFRYTAGKRARRVPRLGELRILQEVYRTVESLEKHTTIVQACENEECVHPDHLALLDSPVGFMLRLKEECRITESGCWLWYGRTVNDLPYVMHGRKNYSIPRFVYAVERGLKVLPATTGVVKQTCGNANCVSFKHIEIDVIPDTCSEGHRLGHTRVCKTCTRRDSREHHSCPRGHTETYWGHNGLMTCDQCNREDATEYLRETSKDFLARWG